VKIEMRKERGEVPCELELKLLPVERGVVHVSSLDAELIYQWDADEEPNIFGLEEGEILAYNPKHGAFVTQSIDVNYLNDESWRGSDG